MPARVRMLLTPGIGLFVHQPGSLEICSAHLSGKT